MRKHIFDDNVTLEFKIKNNSENELEKFRGSVIPLPYVPGAT